MGTKIEGIPFHGPAPSQKHWIGPSAPQRMFQKAESVAEYAGLTYGTYKGFQTGWRTVAPGLRGARAYLDRVYEYWYQMPFPKAAEAAVRAGAIF